MNFTISKKIILFFILLSFFLTANFLGLDNLSFSNINWLYGGGDISNAQNGWLFFKSDEWRFPLGKNPSYGLEISSSIIFSDSVPLFAFIFKIFRNFFGENFQYFSLWIFFCFFLQLYISYLIIYKICKNSNFAIASSLIFVLAPIFIYRISFHMSLGAQWLILLGFYLNLEDDNRKKTIYWILILILSTLVHLYFSVMLIGIYSAQLLQNLFEQKKFLDPVLKLGSALLIMLFFMYIFGYFEAPVMGAVSRGYGDFKLDLLSIIDPIIQGGAGTWSNFLPDIKGTSLEGFNYFGLGNLFIISVAFLIFIKKILKEKNFLNELFKKNIGYIIFVIIFSLWSLTTNITIAGNEIINLPLNKYIFGALSVFASTGRFFWPVYYLIIIFSLIIIFNNFKSTKVYYILIFSLLIQIADTYPRLKYHFVERKHIRSANFLEDKIWKDISNNYEKLRTTYLFNNYGLIFDSLSHFLGTSKIKKTDIILSGSLDRAKAAEVRYNFNNYLSKNKLPEDTAYIVDNLGHLKIMKKLLENTDVGFFYKDNLWLALPKKRNKMETTDKLNLDQIKLDEMEINQRYKFDFNKSKKFLGIGWSHNSSVAINNDAGTWSEGNVSFLQFSIKNGENKNLELKLDFAKYKQNNHKDYKAEIFLNNKLKQVVDLQNHDNTRPLVLKLDQHELEDENTLMFKFYNLISPLSVLESPDARKLGILLNSIAIQKQ